MPQKKQKVNWKINDLIYDQLAATGSIFNKVADFETAVFQHVALLQLFLENFVHSCSHNNVNFEQIFQSEIIEFEQVNPDEVTLSIDVYELFS